MPAHIESACETCGDRIFVFPGKGVSRCRCVGGAVFPLANVESVSELLARPPIPTEWLVHDLFPAGYLLMIYAPEGVGKTILAFNLALSVASGTRFLGRETQSGPVLYLDEENPDQYAHDSLLQMCRARKIDPAALADRFFMGRFALSGRKPDEWCSQLTRTIELIRPALVVLDTFSSILPNVENIENDNAVMRAYLRYLRIAKIGSPGTAIVVLHHPPRGADRPRGAGAIGQDVDAYYSLRYQRGRPAIDKMRSGSLLIPGKARRLAGVPGYRIRAVRTSDSFDLVGEQIATSAAE